MAHACTHTTCLHDNYNERATYSSKTKTSHHERTATCHPCCASTTEMCSTGMKVSSKHTLPQFVARQTLKYPCRHTGCVYSYKHQPSRSDHEREAKNHTRCIPSECDGCRIISAYERAAPRTHERPPDPKLTRFIQQLEQTAKSPPATLQGATFAKKLWGQEPDDTYVVQFGKDGPQVVPFNVLKENVPQQPQRPSEEPHSIETLLEVKDTCSISDTKWGYFCEKLRIKGNCSIHYIRRAREAAIKDLKPTKTPGGRGHELDIHKLLQFILERVPADPNSPVYVKFSFDGATITSGKRKKQEQGTLTIITGKSLQELKSHKAAHQFIIYLGEEGYQQLVEELQNVLPTIQAYINGEKVSAGGVEYTVEPFLVCDMACLVIFLGLYDVFHPSSTWKCCWCHCSCSDIGNFSYEKWLFRDMEKMLEIGEKITEATASRTASTYCGQKAKPLLSFPMDHILPCNLHQVMAVVRAMVARLSELADEEPQVAVALEEVLLSNCKIKLVKAETKSKKKRKFSQRVEKSRLSRPELLNIVEEQRDIMNVFKEKSIKISEDRKKKMVQLWECMWYLLEKAMAETSDMTEHEWLEKARAWGALYVSVYSPEDVTPYLHVFVYHVGFFLEKYKSLEIFANYNIECRVRYNKHTIATATNGFSLVDRSTANSLTYQELTKSLREDMSRLPALPSSTSTSSTPALPATPPSPTPAPSSTPAPSTTPGPTVPGKYDTWAKRSLHKRTQDPDFPTPPNKIPALELPKCMRAEQSEPSLQPVPAISQVNQNQIYTMARLCVMKVPELKQILKERGMQVSGRKSDLIDRILQ